MSQPPYPPHQDPPQQQAALPTCWWHPNRQTGLRCTRCERPACPDCLREASVGYQCIDCVQSGQRQQRAQQGQYRRAGFGARTAAGARPIERPIVTPVLIAINVLVFILTAAQAQDPMNNGAAQLHQDGVLWPIAVVSGDEWWRLITSGFLHYGLLHVAMNMFALWILGRDLEMLLGRLRFTGLYFVSLLGGSTAVFLFDDIGKATAGASGAIYGLLGGILVAVLKLRLKATPVLFVIGLNAVLTFSIPNISWLGHLGGFVIGALIMLAMLYAPAKNRGAWQGGAVALLAVALIGLVLLRDVQLANATCSVLGNQLICTS